MAHLFFSYAHADYDRLFPVFQRMELVTERMIWIDRLGLHRDAEWAAMIERAITSSYGVIFAVTGTFITRPFILEKEIPWAVERFNNSRQGKLLFPILFDDVPLPESLDPAKNDQINHVTHVLDARGGDTERMIRELQSVIPDAPPTSGDEYPFVVSWPRLRNFKGRDQQLVELHQAVHAEDGKAGIKTAGLYGMGGIGKTQLAVEFAYRYRFYFPGGVFWLNAAQNWQQEIADVADRLGLKPADPDDTNRNKQMALAFERHRREDGQDALLVLDNVENPGDLATREIAPKLTIPALCRDTRTRLILTTRVQTLPEGFARVEVTKLAPDDARAVLLDAWQGGEDAPPRADPPDTAALDAIARLFDYLPLPLGWMAAALRQMPDLPPADLLAELRGHGVDEVIQTLAEEGITLGTPAYYAALVGAGLDWQIAQVEARTPDALRLLALLAAYDEAAIIPLDRLRLLTGWQDSGIRRPFRRAVEALRAYSLVEDQRDGAALRIHPLEHAHLRRKWPDFAARLGEAAENLLAAYRTPEALVRETLARGFDAVLADLRETRTALPPGAPTVAPLAELLRTFDWEAHHLRVEYPAENPTPDGGQYVVQHIRERAHHQGTDTALRDACDVWLDAHRLPHFCSHDAWRHPHDPALIRIFEGHENVVTTVAFAPDGRTVLSGSYDRTLRLWDTASGTELRRFEGHSSAVSAVAFAPDGRTVLSGSGDSTLRLWDAASGEELRRFVGHEGAVTTVAFAPDGRTILSGSDDRTLRLWDAASGEELRRFVGRGYDVNAVAFAPDGRTILSGSDDGTLRLWDAASGVELRRFVGHGSWVNTVAFALDGRTVLSGSDDMTLRLWDVDSGEELRRFAGHSDNVNAVAFAPDGRTVLSGSDDRTLRLWDVTSGVELCRLEGHGDWLSAVAFAPDGRTVLSGSDDRTLRLWEAASKKELRHFVGHGDSVYAAALVSDGGTVLSGSDDGTLRLWDTASGFELRRFEGHAGRVYTVAFAPDGRMVLSGSGDWTLRLWDTASGTELRRIVGHEDPFLTVAFAPDGRTILSGSYDGTLRLWDTASGTELRRFEGHEGQVYAVTFAPDGRTVLSGSLDMTLRLWDAASGAELRRIVGHGGWVHAVAFAPDGRMVLSGSGDRTLRLWDAASGAELRRFVGHGGWVHAVAFAPDGRTILSGSGDKTLRLWDVQSGALLAVLRLEAPVECLAVAATIPPSIVVGGQGGGLWLLRLHLPGGG